MSADERKTPICDGRAMNEVDVAMCDLERYYVPIDVARALERQCQELAEACAGLIQTNGYCECERCLKGNKALSNWAKLQEGIKQ